MSKDWCYFVFLLHDHSLCHRIGVIFYPCYMTILCITGLVLFFIPVTRPFFVSQDWCYFMFLLHYHSLYHRIGVILYSCYTTILYVTGLVLFYVFVTLPFFVS